MATRPKLSGIKTAKINRKSAVEDPATLEKPVETGTVQSAATSKSVQPGRIGKVHVSGHFPPEVRKQLKAIALEEDKTTQQLLGEGLNLLFASYGRPEIAPTEKE